MTTRTIRAIFAAGILSAAVTLGAWSGAPAWASAAHSHADAHAHAPVQVTDTAFLVVAPDRGFLGNAEVQDAFEAFTEGRNGRLVYTTDDRARKRVESAVRSLEKSGAKRIVVLPFFVSASDPGYRHLQAILGDPATHPGSTLSWSRPFGESYFAVEMLADRFRSVSEPAGRRVLVVGAGASDAESQRRMAADWQTIAQKAAQGFGFESVRVLVNVPRGKLADEMAAALKDGPRPVVVPFHMGKKLDGMMSFDAFLQGMLPPGADWIEGDLATHPAMPLWLEREANRALPMRPEDIGVVLLAHGANLDWNETMLEAVRPLEKRYKIEPALSMADPIVVERAIRRLERRGAKGIVIVRVFGLSSSFQQDVERMIGADVEAPSHEGHHAAHGSSHGAHGGHGGPHGGTMAPARIRTSALLATVGGLDAHPLFAAALLDRANALSKDPSKETVILTAHGAEEDAANQQWQQNLASLAATMRKGSKYRAIRVGTWREDWPEKSEAEIRAIRSYVQEAGQNGGRAIVIPARTNDRGPEQELLQGLNYELGTGFAPHPKFAQWFEEQIQAGSAKLMGIAGEPHHHAH